MHNNPWQGGSKQKAPIERRYIRPVGGKGWREYGEKGQQRQELKDRGAAEGKRPLRIPLQWSSYREKRFRISWRFGRTAGDGEGYPEKAGWRYPDKCRSKENRRKYIVWTVHRGKEAGRPDERELYPDVELPCEGRDRQDEGGGSEAFPCEAVLCEAFQGGLFQKHHQTAPRYALSGFWDGGGWRYYKEKSLQDGTPGFRERPQGTGGNHQWTAGKAPCLCTWQQCLQCIFPNAGDHDWDSLQVR